MKTTSMTDQRIKCHAAGCRPQAITCNITAGRILNECHLIRQIQLLCSG